MVFCNCWGWGWVNYKLLGEGRRKPVWNPELQKSELWLQISPQGGSNLHGTLVKGTVSREDKTLPAPLLISLLGHAPWLWPPYPISAENILFHIWEGELSSGLSS